MPEKVAFIPLDCLVKLRVTTDPWPKGPRLFMRILVALTFSLLLSYEVWANPSQRFTDLLEQVESIRGVTQVEDATASCGETEKKEFVQLVAAGDSSLSFDPWYRWYKELAEVDPDYYPTAQAYLDALTAPLGADGRDPGFSYLTTQAEDDARGGSGAYVGFGFQFTIDDAGRFLFIDVLQDTPAGNAGFIRSDEIIAVDVGNGFEPLERIIERHFTYTGLFDEMFGESEKGVERGFRVRRGANNIEAILVKDELVTPPLAVDPLLIERAGRPVGYLNLRSFIGTANAALEEAALLFREAGVTDLVIDFRYNGGGRLDVADTMLDLFGGAVDSATGKTSWRLSHNDKRRSEDFSAVFAELPNSMRPDRIAFITTAGTASASELVINSLAPHIEVVLIGADTLGKAVGQYAFDQNLGPEKWAECDTRLRLIAFEIVNGEGDGGYYNGLAGSQQSMNRFTLCPAEDDFSRGFGDPQEASLNAALNWFEDGGSCAVSARGLRRPMRLQRNTADPLKNLTDRPSTMAPLDLSPWVR